MTKKEEQEEDVKRGIEGEKRSNRPEREASARGSLKVYWDEFLNRRVLFADCGFSGTEIEEKFQARG